jgi:hypothetical protein
MIEKKTMWYYDFAYPDIEPKIVSVYVNTDTNNVEVYLSEGDTYSATTNDRFYNTKVEAFDAMDKRIQELTAGLIRVRTDIEHVIKLILHFLALLINFELTLRDRVSDVRDRNLQP